jgi:hypothetical protein
MQEKNRKKEMRENNKGFINHLTQLVQDQITRAARYL